MFVDTIDAVRIVVRASKPLAPSASWCSNLVVGGRPRPHRPLLAFAVPSTSMDRTSVLHSAFKILLRWFSSHRAAEPFPSVLVSSLGGELGLAFPRVGIPRTRSAGQKMATRVPKAGFDAFFASKDLSLCCSIVSLWRWDARPRAPNTRVGAWPGGVAPRNRTGEGPWGRTVHWGRTPACPHTSDLGPPFLANRSEPERVRPRPSAASSSANGCEAGAGGAVDAATGRYGRQAMRRCCENAARAFGGGIEVRDRRVCLWPPRPRHGPTTKHACRRKKREHVHYPKLASRIDNHGLLQQVLHGLRWFCSHIEPSLDFRCFQLRLVPDGIVPAQFLQCSTVALVPGVHGHDPVERKLLPSEALETQLHVAVEVPYVSVSEAFSPPGSSKDASRSIVRWTTTHLHGRLHHGHVSGHRYARTPILLHRRKHASAPTLVPHSPSAAASFPRSVPLSLLRLSRPGTSLHPLSRFSNAPAPRVSRRTWTWRRSTSRPSSSNSIVLGTEIRVGRAHVHTTRRRPPPLRVLSRRRGWKGKTGLRGGTWGPWRTRNGDPGNGADDVEDKSRRGDALRVMANSRINVSGVGSERSGGVESLKMELVRVERSTGKIK